MECKKCKKEKYIVNKYFCLCQECNNERLHGNKFRKRYIESKKVKKSPKSPKKHQKTQPYKQTSAKKTKEAIKLDEKFYEICFKMSDHTCEECEVNLPTDFRDLDGKIIARFRYSHIVPKSIAKSLRHNVENINHLCLKCHTQWDFGDKKSMKIFKKNKKRFPNYF